ncbi:MULTISPECIES: hypothetical protein [Pectobacterium]|uniref:hypothetical protein n=1 Tax=Pectobacterium TaxID=122277 RepID=UPI00069BF018|nr:MULTISPECIES: hypothetical protein [Pectobacterium]MCG5047477.1 hypothetical protein [Pectobacterium brasiliense]PXB04099.1 hypothetical protein DMB41_01950 [Pectobacterium carotovorum subsp. carotovorum]
MSKFRMGYLDEDESDIARFYDFIKKYDIYEFIDFKPKPSVEDLIDEINSSNLDILVIDFQINEYVNINYNGVKVFDLLRSKRKNFPCIILTSFADDAISESFDTHIVYSKSIPFGCDTESKNIFELKIRKSIEHYTSELQKASNEFSELTSLDNLTLEQENRLIELDEFLESQLSNDIKIPKHLKTSQHVGNIKELITRAEDILEKLDTLYVPTKKE